MNLCAGTYELTVTDENGCTAESFYVLRDGNTDCLEYREVITPDGDGRNENFIISCANDLYSNNNLKIFNRWGEQVYAQSNYYDEWRGTDQSGTLELPDGGYFFVFEYTEDGTLRQLKGHITIIRE